MSRERLREAIEYMDRHLFAHDTKRFRLILAAARAYACKRCNGSGSIKFARPMIISSSCSMWNLDDIGYAPCPDCKEYCRIADGEE